MLTPLPFLVVRFLEEASSMHMLTTRIGKPFGVLEHGPLFSLDECVDGHTLAPKQAQAAFDSCLGKDQKGEDEELVVKLIVRREKLLPLLD
jgi:hypothetical protein